MAVGAAAFAVALHFNPPGAWLKPRPSLTHAALVAAHASTVSPSSVVGAGRAAGIARPPTPLGALALAASVGQQCRPARRAFWPRVVAIAKGVALVRGKLSKAQVVAYLLADTLGIEILEGEAMR